MEYIYKKFKVNKLHAIVLPIFLLLLFGLAMSNDNTNISVEMNIIEENVVSIESLMLNETEIEIDIKETKDILVNIQPTGADITELKFNSTNPQIANFSKNDLNSNETTVYGSLKPVAEGECEIYVEENQIQSNKVKIKVIDKQRIENERKAKEEQAKKEAEEKAKKEAEEAAAKKAAQEQAKKQTQTQSKTQTTKSKTSTTKPKTTTNASNSRTVYITPTGKRYHYSSTCGGKNSTPTTLSKAKSYGLTPCKKCAQ